MWTLQTLNPNALELNRLWHEHGYAAAVRLLDVTSPDLLERLPVKVNGRHCWSGQHPNGAGMRFGQHLGGSETEVTSLSIDGSSSCRCVGQPT